MGLATCLNAADTERLQEALDAPLDAMSTDSAGLFPEFEQLEAFAGRSAGGQLPQHPQTVSRSCGQL